MSIFAENALRAPCRQLLEVTFIVLMLYRAHIQLFSKKSVRYVYLPPDNQTKIMIKYSSKVIYDHILCMDIFKIFRCFW